MLRHLRVENIALIEQLDLDFEPGLTVITGETGAGKSILIDALSLILGARADSGLIRSGCEQAVVIAEFQVTEKHPIRDWLREKDLDRGEETILLRRVLAANGRSRAIINEYPVPVATLEQAGALLVELHGQHEHQSLLNPGVHRAILDAFAGHGELVEAVANRYRTWRDLGQKLADWREKIRSAAERRVFLAYQLEELTAASVQPGEGKELEIRRLRLANAAKLGRAVDAALTWLSDGEPTAEDLLARAVGEVRGVSAADPALASLAGTMEGLHYELRDLAERLRHYLDGLPTDPDLLEELDDRLETIRRLSRKHRCEPDQLAQLAEAWQTELEQLEQADTTESQWLHQWLQAELAYRQVAGDLGHSRRQAMEHLISQVEQQLKDLHMANTRFAVTIIKRIGEPRAVGDEDIAFQVSANPGEPLQPLRQVASGGELSRLMLALKIVLTDAIPVTTLIFDEVDVGVGGRTADAIGNKLAQAASQTSRNKQVLAITHLPQVAAWGTWHLRIQKQTSQGRTRVIAERLDPAQREEELARMLAGEKITDSARENARALLQLSRGSS